MKLGYNDEQDRIYGATGMSIGLLVYDGEEMLSAVDIDAEPGHIMEMANSFYFAGNPQLSAKAAWNQTVHSFNLMSVMMLSNVMCRALVHKSLRLDGDVRRAISDIILSEGRESCSLDNDELNQLIAKNYDYLYKVFSHYGVQGIAHDFARTMGRMRRMSRAEVMEALRGLNRL